jgi:hypothetical protein
MALHKHFGWVACTYIAATLVAACTGNIKDGSGPGGGPGSRGSGAFGSNGPGSGSEPGANGPGNGDAAGTGAGSGAGGSGAGASAGMFTPVPAAMRKLSVIQYQNSVRALLGDDVQLTVVLEPDTQLNGFVEIAGARATVSPTALEKYEDASYELAAQALVASRRAAFVGCTPSGVTDDGCAGEFIERFGRRAWRRPLGDDEIQRYVEIANTAATTLNDFYGGIEFATAGLLQSPNFIFRVEIGEADPSDSSRLRYTDYEMASRLSFLLWNTTPDDELLDAADAGELTTTAGLLAQVDRMLDDPRTRAAMTNFNAERLGLDALPTVPKDADLFPEMSPELGAAMRDDILKTLDDRMFTDGADYRDVFDTRTAFVNDALAELYGVSAPGGDGRVELPADELRQGLLSRAGLLALNAHVRNTSPTLRGKFVRERVLCQSIPPPPNDV